MDYQTTTWSDTSSTMSPIAMFTRGTLRLEIAGLDNSSLAVMDTMGGLRRQPWSVTFKVGMVAGMRRIFTR